jgi:hypothetical protein
MRACTVERRSVRGKILDFERHFETLSGELCSSFPLLSMFMKIRTMRAGVLDLDLPFPLLCSHVHPGHAGRLTGSSTGTSTSDPVHYRCWQFMVVPSSLYVSHGGVR